MFFSSLNHIDYVLKCHHLDMKNSLLGSLILGLILSSCASSPVATPTISEEVSILSQQNALGIQSQPFGGNEGYVGFDDRLAEISRRFPSFGGYYLERDSNTYIIQIARTYKGRIINEPEGAERGRRLGQIRREVENFLLAEGHATPEDLKRAKFRFSEVEHSYGALQEWRYQLRALLGTKIGLLYIDAKGNSLVVREIQSIISEDLDRQSLQTDLELRRAIEGTGVPLSAVNLLELGVEVLERQEIQGDMLQNQSTVTKTLDQSVFSPALAGTGWRKQSDGQHCTIGLNVSYNGISGFLTASHCTRQQGNDVIPQVAYAAQTSLEIGRESYDPSTPIVGCLGRPTAGGGAGYYSNCRYADVAFMAYSVPSYRGRIVRTTEGARYTRTVFSQMDASGSTTDPSHPLSQFTPTIGRPSEGTLLHNLGRTGGWKTGLVINNNADIAFPGGSTYGEFVILNAVFIAMNGEIVTCSGDSGGPWYIKNTNGTLTAAGIQSGASVRSTALINGQNCYSEAAMTPIENIARSFPGTMIYGQ